MNAIEAIGDWIKIVVMAGCFGAIVLTGTGSVLYEERDLSNIVTERAFENINQHVPLMSAIDADFVRNKTEECFRNPEIQRDFIDYQHWVYGFTGMSQDVQDHLVAGLIEECLHRYVSDAPTIVEMETRTRKLGAMAPYKSDEIALLLRNEFK